VALRSELNIITNTKLRHYGRFTEGPTDLANRLRNMKGSFSNVGLGVQMEYYGRSLRDFVYPRSNMKWNPYALLGFRYNMYKNDLNSSLGDWREDITVFPNKWRSPEALAVGNGTAFSGVLGGGFRYKLTPFLDLNTQLNLQFFFSDALDGLQAKVPENKNNEWLINLQVGMIYHLNFNQPLVLW
jgi:hypothetical protein